jgi:glycosyltransferase involved in cell wall biosynthesis
LRIIEAFADYNKQFPNTKLVIVGKKGWQSDEVFELVQKLNIEEKVVFEDYVSGKELSALYLHAKALIFTSLYEGFGIPSLEAMSLGCPVIASDQKAIAEVTENAAVLVDPTDKYAISAAMLELEIRPEKRKELIKKGFHQNMKFNWKKSAEKLYNQIKS